ncbi:MAG: cytosine permease [Ferroplasma sp.]|uniref:purine-cytosine permease family protein n=1 Tax=Ferroplasma sp. TaxID=2591003 RepID=UPI0028152E86|nr:cytosine permease [Ferroplasma sp.]WMT52019.1 MAG: cytosine permease [Ferroplasma sp.]
MHFEKKDGVNPQYAYGEFDPVPYDMRKNNSSELFTIWFASNLTVGDFAIGFIPVLLGLSIQMALFSMILGSIMGSLLVGFMSKTGTLTGLPQMILGRRAFGKHFGIFMTGLQWLNTLGWLTVNLILASFAFSLAFHIPYYEISILAMAVVIFLISNSGRKAISYFEKTMSLVLGILFIFIVANATFHAGELYAYKPMYYGFGVAFGITLATSFSYLMSWGPYAADYSRYNKTRNSFIYTFSGGLLATVWAEIAGLLVAIMSLNPSGNPAGDLSSVLGSYGVIGLSAIFLGGIAADAINLYSNSISLKSTGLNLRRIYTVATGIIIATVLSIILYTRFYSFYEDFLFLLDYWITPWLGIMIADFFIVNKNNAFNFKSIPGFNVSGIFSYFMALAISIPFMDPGIIYEGVISKLYLGGVDISYYISFILALLLYPLMRKIINRFNIHIHAE